ncbi:hybrid-cluster NAD(P)-dependent oxidoreductase [Curvibacter sp. CHRR-16]|uniref:hybrid-cluster NAD(P)-dependent oxidoreductase n=1 Tax=Curvibacter sp. CHRR-16 TaxID=2835872 RepID=UPI002023AC31|nr:hybrid-cluster NAD(P)-dependent oxidoreductase [Curvibacter sp. CHRR-16]
MAEPTENTANAYPPIWPCDDDTALQCIQVVQETHDVKTFVFNALQARTFVYRPGQFITLDVPAGQGGSVVQRSYTLSSSPSRPQRVSITVKRVAGGPVSNWLHDYLQPGMQIGVTGPAGDFSCMADSATSLPAGMQTCAGQRYLLISGGSGITPVMSMLRTMVDMAVDADIVFVHAARTPADLIFHKELTLLAHQHPRLRLLLVCESRGAHTEWSGYVGRLSRSLLEQQVPDLLQRQVFTCGPAGFMQAVRASLLDAGLPEKQYQQESFSFETLAQAVNPVQTTTQNTVSTSEGSAVSGGFTISLSKLGDAFACAPDQSILGAAVAAGLRLPASCSTGLCGTCKTKKVSGEVSMQHKGGIRQREIDQGWILPCCSVPLSDVVLER